MCSDGASTLAHRLYDQRRYLALSHPSAGEPLSSRAYAAKSVWKLPISGSRRRAATYMAAKPMGPGVVRCTRSMPSARARRK